jgi:hypothetical protein
MEPSMEIVLQAALALLAQFVEPDEDTVLRLLAEAGVPLPEDEDYRYALTRTLQPREGDHERVFLGDAAQRAREGYAPLWADDPGPVIEPKRGQTQLQVATATAAAMRDDPAVAFHFPGGYRDIVDRLVPDLYWVAWTFTEPGEELGMQYNGLVYLPGEQSDGRGGRFAWFPKPWRVL